MAVLPYEARRLLESTVVDARGAAELGCRVELERLGVLADRAPDRLDEPGRAARRRLRARFRQVGGDFGVLVGEAAYEQWHRLLFARFLAENGLLIHPEYGARLTIDDCADLAESLGEPDGWAVAGRYAAEILPGVFRLDDPLTQLRLAPEHRVALEQAVEGLPAEVFRSDDGLGWVYQFWQSEAKDAVNASERKVGGADLAPVTQLFTENYMVRFLLENSLGAWWAACHPDSPLIKEWQFLRLNEDGQPTAGGFEGWPDRVADVTVMDPCCGSGHFLVEAFDMLWRMRSEEEALDRAAAQDAVLQDNLFGLELDPRRTELAAFNLVLTAWKTGGYRPLSVPHVACSGIAVKAPLEEWTALADGESAAEAALERLHLLFRDADTLGSLIDPRRAAEMDDALGQRPLDSVTWAEVQPLLGRATAAEAADPAAAVLGSDAAAVARAADYLSRRYTLTTTNPPFLDIKRQSELLAQSVRSWHDVASRELAVVFMDRCARLAAAGGSLAMVTPATWSSARPFAPFRRRLLAETCIDIAANLGNSAFESIGGEVVNVILLVRSTRAPTPDESMSVLDVSAESSIAAKADGLKVADTERISHEEQLSNPHSRFMFVATRGRQFIGDVASGSSGIQTGDNNRFQRSFWELDRIDGGWIRLQRSATETAEWTGLHLVLRWENGSGALHEFVARRLGEQGVGSWIRGLDVWGKKGVALSRIGDVPASLYTGAAFADNACILIPHRDSDLGMLWAFCSSGGFADAVRSVDQRLSVTLGTFLGVPIDADRWRQVAAESYPQGLPEPSSDDPTQWLFGGDPATATKPLQVAVARLLGYHWPDQPEESALASHVDADGVVCLPAVGGEQPAAERLRSLLADAFGSHWSATVERRLIAATGSKKKNLADWLRDDFFKQHCKVFGDRPFVWQIWDGRKDGFSALVRYHRLDRGLLEKLTFAILGWWIERQRDDATRGEPGAAERLGAATDLQARLKLILEGEAPYDVYVRWKELWEQPIGWDPDLDDGVRLNIRPFVQADVLRSKVGVHWRKDRGKNPDGSERHNDRHLTISEKREARRGQGT